MTFVAQTESSRQVDIVARVSGYLDRIAYREGELVKEGQLLFQLDPQAVPGAARRGARASCRRSRRASPPPRRTSSGSSRSPSRTRCRAPTSTRRRASTTPRTPRCSPRRRRCAKPSSTSATPTIRSPVTGSPSRSPQRQGAYVNAHVGQRAAHLRRGARSDLGQLQRVAEPDGAHAQDWSPQGRVVAPQGRGAAGRARSLRRLAPIRDKGRDRLRRSVVQPGHRLVPGARGDRPIPKRALRPGMFVTARVEGIVRPNAIVVPQLAVQQGSNGHLVYVVKPDSVAGAAAGRRSATTTATRTSSSSTA